MNKEEKLWNGFVSNTVIGTGNNFVLFLNKGEKRTYVSFLKPIYTGDFTWKFWYANTVDSTFEWGDAAYACRPGGNFTVKDAFIGCADTPDIKCIQEVKKVTYGGKTLKKVFSDECFWSDEVQFSIEEGKYVVFGWTIVPEDEVTVVPMSPDSQIPCLESVENGDFFESVYALKPNLFAIKKNDVKQLGFLGDSITQGCGTENNKYEFWAGRIGNALREHWSTWNLGLGYARARDAAKQGIWFYKACQCDALVICLGINEVFNDPEESAEDILRSLADMIDGFKEHHPTIRIILFTLPPIHEPDSRIDVWRQVNAGIRGRLSNKVEAVFDIAKVLGNANGVDYRSVRDNLHPDGEGGRIVAEAFLGNRKFWLSKGTSQECAALTFSGEFESIV